MQIYKRGSNVRIDTTLVGFDITSNWKRGNQSFIFRFSDNCQAQLIVLDHDSKTVGSLLSLVLLFRKEKNQVSFTFRDQNCYIYSL